MRNITLAFIVANVLLISAIAFASDAIAFALVVAWTTDGPLVLWLKARGEAAMLHSPGGTTPLKLQPTLTIPSSLPDQTLAGRL